MPDPDGELPEAETKVALLERRLARARELGYTHSAVIAEAELHIAKKELERIRGKRPGSRSASCDRARSSRASSLADAFLTR